jgi:hypothetical protein
LERKLAAEWLEKTLLLAGGILGIYAAHIMFSNPAVIFAWGLFNTFVRINPINVAAFLAMQLLAVLFSTPAFSWFLSEETEEDT